MTREQLQRLGEAALRQLAQRIGLRGALQHDRELLITGLAAYFARRPARPDEDDEPDEGPRTADIPPALATETMARLLEAQGKDLKADALRSRLGQRPDSPADRPSVESEVGSDGLVSINYCANRVAESLASDASLELSLVIRLWGTAGQRTEARLIVATHEGCEVFEPPADTQTLCVALGTRRDKGPYRPLARSSLLTLTPDDHAGGNQ